PMGVASVEVDGDVDIQLSLSVRPRVHTPQAIGPTLRFRTPSEMLALPSHSIGAESALREARSGGNELEGVSLPIHAGVRLRTRPNPRLEWTPRNFDWNLDLYVAAPAAYRQQLEHGLLAELLRALRSSDELDLDFGNFGSLHLSADPAVSAVRRELKISTSLRRRIQWVSLLAQRAGRSGSQIPMPELVQSVQLLLTPPLHVANADDRAMLTHLG